MMKVMSRLKLHLISKLVDRKETLREGDQQRTGNAGCHKSRGADGIPPILLKKTAKTVSKSTKRLFKNI